MATGSYRAGRRAQLKGEIDYESDSISAALIYAGEYTVDLDTDVDIGDISEDAILSEVALSGKTVINDIFNCDPMTFSSVSGISADAIVIFKSVEAVEDCILLYYIDNASEFPITLDGTDVIVSPSATGLVQLV